MWIYAAIIFSYGSFSSLMVMVDAPARNLEELSK